MSLSGCPPEIVIEILNSANFSYHEIHENIKPVCRQFRDLVASTTSGPMAITSHRNRSSAPSQIYEGAQGPRGTNTMVFSLNLHPALHIAAAVPVSKMCPISKDLSGADIGYLPPAGDSKNLKGFPKSVLKENALLLIPKSGYQRSYPYVEFTGTLEDIARLEKVTVDEFLKSFCAAIRSKSPGSVSSCMIKVDCDAFMLMHCMDVRQGLRSTSVNCFNLTGGDKADERTFKLELKRTFYNRLMKTIQAYPTMTQLRREMDEEMGRAS